MARAGLIVSVIMTLVSVAARGDAAAAIDGNVTNQVIRGFGASSAWHSQAVLAPAAATLWANDNLDGHVGMSILRTRIDPNGSFAGEAGPMTLAHAAHVRPKSFRSPLNGQAFRVNGKDDRACGPVINFGPLGVGGDQHAARGNELNFGVCELVPIVEGRALDVFGNAGGSMVNARRKGGAQAGAVLVGKRGWLVWCLWCLLHGVMWFVLRWLLVKWSWRG
jgi:hypothetical protein